MTLRATSWYAALRQPRWAVHETASVVSSGTPMWTPDAWTTVAFSSKRRGRDRWSTLSVPIDVGQGRSSPAVDPARGQEGR